MSAKALCQPSILLIASPVPGEERLPESMATTRRQLRGLLETAATGVKGDGPGCVDVVYGKGSSQVGSRGGFAG
jgi:hypothetical protein